MSDPTPFSAAYPVKLRNGEHSLLKARRQAVGRSTDLKYQVGFGLSGGGIRSATFALGLFQGMAKKGLLRQIDYLSTVSGGGYFGSFFGRLLSRDYIQTPDDVEQVLQQKKYPEILRFLRENGRYLSPNGGGDSLLFGAALLRNWISIHLVLGIFLLAVFLGIQSLRMGADSLQLPLYLSQSADSLIWWSPLLWLPLITFVFVAFPIGWAYWLVEPESRTIEKGAAGGKTNKAQETSAISPLAGLALVFVICAWLAVFTREERIALLWALLAAVAALTYGLWKLAKWKTAQETDGATSMDRELYRDHGVRSRLGLWLTAALTVTALLLALALVDSLGQSLYAVLKGDSTPGAWLTAVFSSLGALAAFARWIAVFFSKGPRGGRPSLPLKLIASVAALLLVALILISLDTASHAIAWGLGVPQGAPARLMEKAPNKEERSYDVKLQQSPEAGLRLSIGSGEPKTEIAAPKPAEERDPWLAFLGFAGTLLLSFLFGQTWPFVNRSSHQPLYGARLTRAYLGASNEKRWNGNNVTQPLEGDDYDLARYWPPPENNGAPIHLINVTINETIDGQSQVQQQDRKGLGLALGPWGLSAGAHHHLVLNLGDDKKMNPEGHSAAIYPESRKEFRVFDYPEIGGYPRFTGVMLPLGAWLSISGAAFSTGTGMRTSLGMSLLTGFGNVRLGRWWDSGVVRSRTPEERARRKLTLRFEDALARLFPVQTHLLDEFLARFPGTARRHWYLSDGGHFENMGGYELLRRRLGLIVIVDGEMDSNYTFEGLANMVRKARIDFGAEVRFLSEEQLDEVIDKNVRPYIGTLEQLRRGKWEDTEGKEKKPHGRFMEADPTGRSLAHAALARVTYDSDDNAASWILYVKPTLTGREPVDLLEYHHAHQAFPQEPTIDQFFDEAQWESYRRLGQYIAEALFGELGQFVPDADRERKPSLLSKWDWEEKDKDRLRIYS